MDEILVQKKSFEFALSIIRLYKKLQARQEFVLSSQLLRSGTSIGVNVEEAASRNQSFAEAIMTAAKEARETRYWLKLLQESHLVDIDVSNELKQVSELMDLLNSIIDDSAQ
jgi:four helix bundle protein